MQACIPNIGRTQRRRRLVFGAIAFMASLALAWALAGVDAHVALRALIALPLYAAALGFFQYREKT